MVTNLDCKPINCYVPIYIFYIGNGMIPVTGDRYELEYSSLIIMSVQLIIKRTNKS